MSHGVVSYNPDCRRAMSASVKLVTQISSEAAWLGWRLTHCELTELKTREAIAEGVMRLEKLIVALKDNLNLKRQSHERQADIRGA